MPQGFSPQQWFWMNLMSQMTGQDIPAPPFTEPSPIPGNVSDAPPDGGGQVITYPGAAQPTPAPFTGTYWGGPGGPITMGQTVETPGGQVPTLQPLDLPAADPGMTPTSAPYGLPSEGGPGSFPNTGGPQVSTPTSTPTAYDPSENPMVWAPNPQNYDPTSNIPYAGIPAPGYDPGSDVPTAPGVPPDVAPADPVYTGNAPIYGPNLYGPGSGFDPYRSPGDPAQPDLNVPFGSAGPPGGPLNLTPSPGAVATMTTLPAMLGPQPFISNIGSSNFQNAIFHGVWFGHQPMAFATWNAGAGTPQGWASRPGGTYENYLRIWNQLRSQPASQQPRARGAGVGVSSGQAPGGAGRPTTAAT